MKTEEMVCELRRLEEAHKDDFVGTGETNWSLMCHDVANRLEELLKAQEPRILRLDELSGNDTAYIEINNLREPVLHCIIFYDKEADGMDVKPIKTNISSAYLRYSEHNRVWRPWTSRPSDAQREAVKWE